MKVQWFKCCTSYSSDDTCQRRTSLTRVWGFSTPCKIFHGSQLRKSAIESQFDASYTDVLNLVICKLFCGYHRYDTYLSDLLHAPLFSVSPSRCELTTIKMSERARCQSGCMARLDDNLQSRSLGISAIQSDKTTGLHAVFFIEQNNYVLSYYTFFSFDDVSLKGN